MQNVCRVHKLDTAEHIVKNDLEMLLSHALSDHELNEVVQAMTRNGHYQENVFQSFKTVLAAWHEQVQ